MKKISAILATAFLVAAPATAFAGMSVDPGPITWEPVGPKMEQPSGDSDMLPALILLGVIGMVVAGGQLGGMATRNNTTMLPDEVIEE